MDTIYNKVEEDNQKNDDKEQLFDFLEYHARQSLKYVFVFLIFFIVLFSFRQYLSKYISELHFYLFIFLLFCLFSLFYYFNE